jgi:hypothetical protein
MHFAEDYIHRFHAMIPWKDAEIVRSSWMLHHGDRLVRDLELWLCEPNQQQLEPMRLKIKAYDVSTRAYATLVSRGKLDLRVHFDELMGYVFMSKNSYGDILVDFTCTSFTFQVEEAAYDEI